MTPQDPLCAIRTYGAAGTPEVRCLVIGEVAQAHDGSLGTAHAYIDAIARAGADCVKFQTHIAAAESTTHEPWRVPFSRQDASRYDYWKRMEFTPEQWRGLKEHAEARGLLFLSSPFSVEACDLLEQLGIQAWKVASGEASPGALLDRMLATRLPLLISTGLVGLEDLDQLVSRCRAHQVPFCLMQCATEYPVAAERVGLNVMDEFARRYRCPVGLSDHSGTVFPGIVAAYLGCHALEVHVALSRDGFGPDLAASLVPSELAELVRGVRYAEALRRHPVDKRTTAHDAAALRGIFSKSLVTLRAMTAGTVLADRDLGAKKPGTGLPETRRHEVIGRTLRVDVDVDHLLKESDLA